MIRQPRVVELTVLLGLTGYLPPYPCHIGFECSIAATFTEAPARAFQKLLSISRCVRKFQEIFAEAAAASLFFANASMASKGD